MTVTAGKLRRILEAMLRDLSCYDDDTPLRMRHYEGIYPDTHCVNVPFICINEEGFIPVCDIIADDGEDEDDEDGEASE